jgi:hypothetical protein
MNDLTEALESLNKAVPPAPSFARRVMNQLPPPAPSTANPKRLRLHRMTVGVIAASLLIISAAGILVLLMAASPRQALARSLQRAEASQFVRFNVRSEHENAGVTTPGVADRRTYSTDGKRRSELLGRDGSPELVVHNPQSCPDADLIVYPTRKIAEYRLVDAARESLSSDDPVQEMKRLAQGVRSAPQEIYRGRSVRIYLSDKPQPIDGGRQWRTTRLLVDRETDLPVRIEITFDMTPIQQGIWRSVYDEFEWNPPLDVNAFSTDPPAGFAVHYDLISPLSHGIIAYAGCSSGKFPPKIDAAALAEAMQRLAAEGRADSKATTLELQWGFAAPAFAARHHLDLRYYGAGKSLDRETARTPIVAAQIAPASDQYDVIMSDLSTVRMRRRELP